MAIQITTMEVISGQSLNYGSSGTYEGLVRFGLTDSLSVSSVTSVRIDAMTMGNAVSSSPTPYTFTISGAALPRTLVVDGFVTEYIGYTVNVNNDYLHANTDNLILSSYMAAYTELSGGTTQGDETSSYTASFMTSNPGFIVARGDAANPSPVSGVTITGINKVVSLTWNNPVDADWTTTYVKQSTTAAVTTTAMGTLVYTASTPIMSAYTLNVPASGETYYYGIYTKDNVNKLSTIVNASVTPTNALPSPVTEFTAVGGDKVVNLTWTNATDEDWVSTSVKMSTVSAITVVGDGTLVYTATAASMSAVAVPVPVDGSEVYYFGAYSTDNVGGNSTIVTATPDASAVPTWGIWTSLAEHGRLYIQGTF